MPETLLDLIPRVANLKFLSELLRAGHRNFKFKAALESICCLSSFDSEVRIGGCRDIKRTSESEFWEGAPVWKDEPHVVLSMV
jgi:hypothetical protein